MLFRFMYESPPCILLFFPFFSLAVFLARFRRDTSHQFRFVLLNRTIGRLSLYISNFGSKSKRVGQTLLWISICTWGKTEHSPLIFSARRIQQFLNRFTFNIFLLNFMTIKFMKILRICFYSFSLILLNVCFEKNYAANRLNHSKGKTHQNDTLTLRICNWNYSNY